MNFYVQQGSIYEASTAPSFNMLSSLMILVILKGFSCEELKPVKTEETSVEDTTVILSYNYSKQAFSSDYFFWYRQYPGKPPEFLISHSATGTVGKHGIPHLMIKVDKNRISLNISSAAVSDSAVYYCAVQTGGVNKMIFGSGTSLTIEPKSVSKPSFYKLSGGDTEACLASGFSRIKAATDQQLELFKHSAAVRVGGESLYNQLALLTTEKDREACEQAEEDSDVCGEPVEPDGRVNMMSVTMLGLRLLFFKTVVFNVLMTLRLWISQ